MLRKHTGELFTFAKEMHILYVENEQDVQARTQILLELIFGRVTAASNGKEGLQLYKEGSFDIVLTDIYMPLMDGISMVRLIRQINPKQMIVIISACEESSYLLELINMGIAQFILKPLRTDQMIEVLHNVVTNIFNQKKVAQMNHTLQQKLLYQTTLLKQYKEVVDCSMIVTQTDLFGIIVYANKAFCDISGYRLDEVLHVSHNIVRHPEVGTEFYRELWKTILQKQTWQGIIRNLDKNKKCYITNATIKPILDEEENITNFISVSYDVTKMYELHEEIWTTQHEMLAVLGEVGETCSNEMYGHVHRVAEYSKILGELCGLDDTQLRLLYSASSIHDIGKIGISDNILLKPDKLSPQEYDTIKTHTQIGYSLLNKSKRPLLQVAALISHEHHEKWDGSGYPRGLKGEDIHLFGRIVALADVFDALSCERVYKKAWPLEAVIDFVQKERGKHFDPKLVDMFMENLHKFKNIAIQARE
jgi:PAS domain S-box-containing protein